MTGSRKQERPKALAETTETILLLTPRQLELFWSYVKKGDPWDCWPWQGYVNEDGYGRWTVRIGGRAGVKMTFYTHRLAYALACEPIPPELEAAHAITCDTRACCNPDHLTPKSHWENMKDQPLTRRAKALAIGVAQPCLESLESPQPSEQT